MRLPKRSALVLGSLALFLFGCGAAPDTGETIGEVTEPVVSAPLGAAYCDINVIGKGVKALEDDYLPHVITCENGGASLEALKAQAIAARSVAYYNIATTGSICDGQGCQVYSCGAAPQAKHYQAVKETAGMYLSYAGLLTYGFYVAGDPNTGGAYCVGNGGATESYVTYNWGKTGGAVKQTSLGYVGPPGFGQNRGCMGQWGARCLESRGFGYADILRFYYGSDIQVLKATGPCSQSCTPHCDGSKIVGQDCGVGDCGVYGATCVDDSKGVRCASVFCPAQGQKKVCVNEQLIGDCNDGAITTGDCSVFGSVCVDDQKGARCAVVFCADEPTVAHDVCLPNGQLGHCTDLGGISVEDCPAAKPCTTTPSGAQCGAAAPSDPDPASGGSAGSGGDTGAPPSGGEAGDDGELPKVSPSGGAGQKTHVLSSDDGGCALGGSPRTGGMLLVWLALGLAASRHRSRRISC